MLSFAAVASFAFGFGLDTLRVERHGPDGYLPFFLMYVVAYTLRNTPIVPRWD
jgi:hypothetical protein